ncbi:hemerythrin domain-containing protein [Streptomyces ficellus]|uniref:Hemerythrin domain-containing protein n=1 Tax=Streptomyces ficellus TaxID=1977088 RepID=A0ABT7ZA39_9ACTN|nr:hemerythrin domain-containing protein [Streptomyces ficellus]MDN3296360.1 hemerythrin domain-containing protein [Streptomyces ficellus]
MPASLAEQTTDELGGERSVLARQRRDHVALDRLMNDYWAAAEPERARLLKKFTQLVFSHAFAEETVLWPVIRRLVPDGDGLTRQVEHEHQEINELTAMLERTKPGGSRHDEYVERIFALVRQDIRDEEDVLLPRLQDALDRRRLVQLGTAWEAARLSSPTHPHPAVPRRPPGNAVLGVPLTLFDRTRDWLMPAGRVSVARIVGTLCAVATFGLAVALRLRKR